MKLSREREKLFNAIIFFCNNTKHCYKTKLMKLLYYLDFWHFKETGRPVTDQIYKAWKMGPVPQQIYNEISPDKNPDDLKKFLFVEEEVFDEINDKKKLVIKPKKSFNEKVFTRRELDLLKKIADVFYEAIGEQMTDSTHLKNAPWDKTVKEKGENAIIDFYLSLDDEENSLTERIVKDKQLLDKENRELLNSI
ncbi:MAG: SocA family protein [Bacteroidetes bacterium]|nr:SocA family protein [Bacteroidota bacterium]MBU2585662.1 SocA family protein [Bacteroidota bacterium]